MRVSTYLQVINRFSDAAPVLYIQKIIRNLSPTSLPGDDFEFISHCLKSLETRTDLSWRIFDETDLRMASSVASRRRGYRDQEITEEPFSIHQRLTALSDHWQALAVLPTKPERWDKESDSTFIPPLINGLLSGDHEEASGGDGTYNLSLTPEQSAEADKIYQKWLKTYKREASYFKDHPPKPIGWVAVPKSELSIRNGWATVLHDGAVQQSTTMKLAVGMAYKPLYDTLQLPPVSWRVPGEVDDRTIEDRRREREEAKFEWEQAKARRALQEDYLRQLGA